MFRVPDGGTRLEGGLYSLSRSVSTLLDHHSPSNGVQTVSSRLRSLETSRTLVLLALSRDGFLPLPRHEVPADGHGARVLQSLLRGLRFFSAVTSQHRCFDNVSVNNVALLQPPRVKQGHGRKWRRKPVTRRHWTQDSAVKLKGYCISLQALERTCCPCAGPTRHALSIVRWEYRHTWKAHPP